MTDMTLARAFSDRNFPAQGRAISASGTTPPLNKLIALPFDAGGTFDALSIMVKSSGSNDSMVRLGVYGSDASGLPGALIVDAGEADTTSTNEQIVIPLDEPRSFTSPFWVVAIFGGETAPTIQASAAIPAIEAQHLFGLSDAQVQASIFSGSNAVVADQSYGALPETFPEGTISTSLIFVCVRT